MSPQLIPPTVHLRTWAGKKREKEASHRLNGRFLALIGPLSHCLSKYKIWPEKENAIRTVSDVLYFTI